MSFEEQMIITLVDKGLLALVIAVVGFALNLLLARQQARANIQQAIAPLRVKALTELWSKTEKLGFAKQQSLSPDQRTSIFQELTKWYYDASGAMFLSHKATGLFLIARAQLQMESITDENIRESFSALRTQLKVDCGIYSLRDARTPLTKSS